MSGLFSDLCALSLIWKGCVDGGPRAARLQKTSPERRSQIRLPSVL